MRYLNNCFGKRFNTNLFSYLETLLLIVLLILKEEQEFREIIKKAVKAIVLIIYISR